jgi:hypothetical protein
LKPKPQRVKKEKKDTSDVSFNNTSSNADSMLAAEQSGGDSSELSLIKMMMLMVEGKKCGKKKESKKQMERSVGEEGPSLIQLAKTNGRYKYSKVITCGNSLA